MLVKKLCLTEKLLKKVYQKYHMFKKQITKQIELKSNKKVLN
jgi:hypothetical protein